ncbi:MAG: shikimate kinase [Planctomycetota bacterium]|jgi:shikimate kinase
MRMIVLMGARAAGKTSVGERLASRLGGRFVDLDVEALRLLGAGSVAEAWSSVGEAGFRRAELGALERLAETVSPAGPPIVLALGGGTPVIPEAGKLLASLSAAGRARIVWLSADADVLARRLAAAPGDRPSLTGEDVAAELAAVLAARCPIYESLADVVVDVDAGPDEVLQRVLAAAQR